MGSGTLAAVVAAALPLCQNGVPDIRSFYPERAQRLEMEGKAVISCTATAAGTLENCSVVSEEPQDFGFGDAAIKMAPLFKMRPTTADGEPVAGGTVRVPVVFKLPPSPKKKFLGLF
jgi:protein TonB